MMRLFIRNIKELILVEPESRQYPPKLLSHVGGSDMQHLATIKNAFLYVEDGQIAEIGSHSELLKKGGKYYHLYTKQFIDQMDQLYDPFKDAGGSKPLPLAAE